MRYLMIHWIDEAVLAGSAAIESEVQAWTAEMDRGGVRLQGEPLRSVSEAATVRIRSGDVLATANLGRPGTAMMPAAARPGGGCPREGKWV